MLPGLIPWYLHVFADNLPHQLLFLGRQHSGKPALGRGSIVNERDLCCALREGLIAGAALDVLSSEPIRSDSPLLKMADDDRLYITPHIAWASKEARTRLIGLVQKNIASYLEGGMENRVV